MRIDPKGSIEGIYEATLKKNTTVADKEAQAEKKIEKDKVEISKTAGSYDELSPIKKKIVEEVEKGTPPSRLRQLKASIENGTYHVSSKDIAEAILDFGGKNARGSKDE